MCKGLIDYATVSRQRLTDETAAQYTRSPAATRANDSDVKKGT